jgi:hypothetical protein
MNSSDSNFLKLTDGSDICYRTREPAKIFLLTTHDLSPYNARIVILKENQMKPWLRMLMALLLVLSFSGCFNNESDSDSSPDITVNSLEDATSAEPGVVTLRMALTTAEDGQTIVFDESLDGGTILLSIVGDAHTILKGEVMGMRDEPSGPVSYLEGYFDRDYGRSALYAQKNVHIDASALSRGITLSWAGGEDNPARVLAVYGDLTMVNVSVTNGASVTEDIATDNPDDQPWTLARGGGVAVWGTARLVGCRLFNNACEGDFDSSRDRGAFGGGLYANIVDMQNCVVGGNTVVGAGAAGGGVYSVGGAGVYQNTSRIQGSSITGNRIRGLFTYGGGIYSDGGGIGNTKTLAVVNCTITQNQVEPPSNMPPFLLGMGYWRGGAVYISNGYLTIQSSTIVDNAVYGVARTDDLSKPNLAGGIAATIGNAHAVEDMTIGHSVIAGNWVHEIGGISYQQDIFTGSLLYFRSMGHNRIGVLDFSQILVPVGEFGWASLSRRHFPKQGDEADVEMADVLNLDTGITRSDTILSAGVNALAPAVLAYEPAGSALDQVPSTSYSVSETIADYRLATNGVDDFLAIFLDRLETYYSLTGFADDFRVDFETFLQGVDLDDETAGLQPYTDPWGDPILTLADTLWFGPAGTWPKELPNYPYIHFWHQLDTALTAEGIPGMGHEIIGDDTWADLFTSGTLSENADITMTITTTPRLDVPIQVSDQQGVTRPAGSLGDIGAIEIP